ncbi:NAD(P)/FAD-dependent oxidoreductase [Mycoplasma sp. Mirounga ES2805-ORL]|uniref:NAD(P)/FAD-dependent oxidoreductase n=1 Tax=Mycoplasma sp. Mirounga ES2805-ORL TaxID=754514 RepID=UPI00197BA5D0|nr:NAD(P)-binding protein [Mycoplasma sp. Mirounga ES2805-ORL]QSF13465.1 NAD(P)-binding protein [Mycoplasma sp. Mirounga ES2805-ORL]
MYDVLIIGAGPGGIYSAYELTKKNNKLKIGLFEKGPDLETRCKGGHSIMYGFGGAGAFSDGKYNITNEFGGTLFEHIGKDTATELMEYVDKVNCEYGGSKAKLYVNTNSSLKTVCLNNDLHLLSAKVRHLGTDINQVVLGNLYKFLKNKVDIHFNNAIESIKKVDGIFYVTDEKNKIYKSKKVIISTGRSGSKWMEKISDKLNLKTKSNRVDIGVRVEVPYEVFRHLTDELYESKLVYQTKKYGDKVRTFCMNPKGFVVVENTDGLLTANGHSYDGEELQSANTNFALLVSQAFTEPFKNSNEYGESIAKLSNMLGGGVIVQRFGDLTKGHRSTKSRIDQGFLEPTLNATPGDLSLVLPKRLLDDIIEMIYTLDKIAPGTANADTLLYGVEVKFYNMEVDVNNNLETSIEGLFCIGDTSGVTHSLSHASASGVYVARYLLNQK